MHSFTCTSCVVSVHKALQDQRNSNISFQFLNVFESENKKTYFTEDILLIPAAMVCSGLNTRRSPVSTSVTELYVVQSYRAEPGSNSCSS